jgi:hypothetical protein
LEGISKRFANYFEHFSVLIKKKEKEDMNKKVRRYDFRDYD